MPYTECLILFRNAYSLLGFQEFQGKLEPAQSLKESRCVGGSIPSHATDLFQGEKMEKMKLPLVSVIMPCYNGTKHLAKTLDCMAAQTYKNIELIFINDGSTDDTEVIFRSYERRLVNEGREAVVYIKQANGGLPNAINAGLKIFKGAYLSWLDSR